MKPRLLLPLLATAALPAALPATPETPPSVAPAKPPVIAHAADGQPDSPGPGVRRGATVEEVLEAIGDPPEMLSREVWVYWDYRSPHPEAARHGRDTLLLRFAAGRVREMLLVPRAEVELVMARVRLNARLRTAAASPTSHPSGATPAHRQPAGQARIASVSSAPP